MVELSVVSQALAARSRACVDELASQLADVVRDAEVTPLGSSFWAGSLSKGDIDLLVALEPSTFDAVVDHLRAAGVPAQQANWSPTFASFSLDLPSAPGVGIQVLPTDAPELASLRLQQVALADAALRRRYDAAKQDGAALGSRGYWLVKDAFWKTRGRSGPTWSTAARPVLKILRPEEWAALMESGETPGAPIDVQDGYVHLSTREQVAETVARHFAGATDLWLLTLDADELSALRWEPSRGGALFPHLYGPLRLVDICMARPWEASSWD